MIEKPCRAKKTTIRDIAAATGVSKSSVARVLNNQPGAAVETRNRVVAAVAAMNYRRGTGRNRPVVAVVISGHQYGLYRSRMEKAVCAALYDSQCRPLVVSDEELDILTEVVADGVISLCVEDRIAGIWGRLKTLPLICINDYGRHIDQIYSVRTDAFRTQSDIVNHLAGLGHRRIGMLRPDAHYSPRFSAQRHEGFFSAMREAGLENEAVFQSFGEPGEFHAAMGRLLEHPVSAVIVMGEGFGAQAAHSLRCYGRRIPEDISLVTQGFPHLSEYLDPPQTCVIQDYDRLAGCAVQALWKLMKGENFTGDILVPARLVVRQSTGKPNLQ